MAHLAYGPHKIKIDFDDRELAHLQVVIGAKLRRRESFFLSWANRQDVGGGRGSIWLDPSMPLFFHYQGSGRQQLNRAWLEALTISAGSKLGLHLLPEPPAPRGHEQGAEAGL